MRLPAGARCPWKLIGFLVLSGAVASSLDWTDPINDAFPPVEVHRREDVHVEPMELRLQVDQYMAHVLGIQGAAFMAFMLAAVMLIRGAWLLTDFVGYRIPGFVLCQCVFFCCLDSQWESSTWGIQKEIFFGNLFLFFLFKSKDLVVHHGLCPWFLLDGLCCNTRG